MLRISTSIPLSLCPNIINLIVPYIFDFHLMDA